MSDSKFPPPFPAHCEFPPPFPANYDEQNRIRTGPYGTISKASTKSGAHHGFKGGKFVSKGSDNDNHQIFSKMNNYDFSGKSGPSSRMISNINQNQNVNVNSQNAVAVPFQGKGKVPLKDILPPPFSKNSSCVSKGLKKFDSHVNNSGSNCKGNDTCGPGDTNTTNIDANFNQTKNLDTTFTSTSSTLTPNINESETPSSSNSTTAASPGPNLNFGTTESNADFNHFGSPQCHNQTENTNINIQNADNHDSGNLNTKLNNNYNNGAAAAEAGAPGVGRHRKEIDEEYIPRPPFTVVQLNNFDMKSLRKILDKNCGNRKGAKSKQQAIDKLMTLNPANTVQNSTDTNSGNSCNTNLNTNQNGGSTDRDYLKYIAEQSGFLKMARAENIRKSRDNATSSSHNSNFNSGAIVPYNEYGNAAAGSYASSSTSINDNVHNLNSGLNQYNPHSYIDFSGQKDDYIPEQSCPWFCRRRPAKQEQCFCVICDDNYSVSELKDHIQQGGYCARKHTKMMNDFEWDKTETQKKIFKDAALKLLPAWGQGI